MHILIIVISWLITQLNLFISFYLLAITWYLVPGTWYLVITCYLLLAGDHLHILAISDGTDAEEEERRSHNLVSDSSLGISIGIVTILIIICITR